MISIIIIIIINKYYVNMKILEMNIKNNLNKNVKKN